MIIYASAEGYPAIARENGLSDATQSFINHFKGYQEDFIDIRSHIMDWNFKPV